MKRVFLMFFIVFAFVSCKKGAIQQTSPVLPPPPAPFNYLEPYTGIYNGTAKHDVIAPWADTLYYTGVKVVVTLGQKDSTVNLQFDYSNGVSEAYANLEMFGLKHESWVDTRTTLKFEFLSDSTFTSSGVYIENQASGKFIDIEANK